MKTLLFLVIMLVAPTLLTFSMVGYLDQFNTIENSMIIENFLSYYVGPLLFALIILWIFDNRNAN